MLSKFWKISQNPPKKVFLSFILRNSYQTKKNLYDILGLNFKCSSEEIKKAYYALAQKFHPDKNNHPNAAEKFNELTYAYDILSDEKQRRMYDSYGGSSKTSSYSQNSSTQKEEHKTTNSSSSFSDHFQEELFQDFDKFFFAKTSQNPKLKQKKGKDITLEIKIKFMESVFGCSKPITYLRRGLCSICKGSRCRPGTFPTKCYTCGGRGNVIFRGDSEDVEDICTKCEGFGKVIKHKCEECKGELYVDQTVSDKISIPVGVGNEQILRKEGQGHIGENRGINGDLYIKVLVEDHPYYKRDGSDIYTKCSLTVSQAVLGTKLFIKTLMGDVEINVEKGTRDGDRKKLSNLGIQKMNNPQNRGNHYIIFNVRMPDRLNDRQYKLFQELSKYE